MSSLVRQHRGTERPAALIVGAGIEGMGIALLLVEAGHPVYLMDNAPWIGGSMHLLDRTFPTDSCGICLMDPVQPAYCPTLECDLHEAVTVLPQTEVVNVEGQAGSWQVSLRHQPRYVVEDKCTRCGLCLEACPESRPGLYEEDLALQRAVYRPPSRAVPDAPVIDMDCCTRCGECVGVCPTGAIDLDMAASSEVVQVAAIVLCPGYRRFDARLKGEYGYGIYENVVTSLQFERMTSPSGSTGGRIVRPSDGSVPHCIAFIHCVGSRDATCAREYCSSVCCMYTAKQVAAAKEVAPNLDMTVFYMDIRAGGKGYEAYFNEVESLPGVTYRRSMVSSLFEMQQTGDLRLSHVGEDGNLAELDFDMVVLSVGLSPVTGMGQLAAGLGVELDSYGFCQAASDRTAETATRGVFVGGTCREPMDIPEVVVDAARVAGEVAGFLTSGQDGTGDMAHWQDAGSTIPETSPEETRATWRDLRDEEPQVGIFVQVELASCLVVDDQTAAAGLDWQDVMDYAAGLPGVVMVRPVNGVYPALASAVESAVTEGKINRVVVVDGAHLLYRSPLVSEVSRLGLPSDVVEWVNLQDGCAFVHQELPELRQAKARQMVAMAVSRAVEERVLRRAAVTVEESIDPHVLVIGGGPSGMAAALGLARQGYPVHLVEKAEGLGGQLRELRSLLSGEDPGHILAEFTKQVESSAQIEIHAGTRVLRMEGRAGRFTTTLEKDGQSFQIEHGAAIVATGGVPVVPHSYHYGENPNILTQRALEHRLAENPDALRDANHIVMIQCVESRDETRPYCSRICCGQAIKNALMVKRLSPQTEVHVLYRDMRTPGFQELAYLKARQLGVMFHRYEPSDKPVVCPTGPGLQVETEEPILGRKIILDADWIVLSAGVDGLNEDLAHMLGVPLDADGFFKESHPKMRPLDFTRPGLYVCGLAHGPCSLPESIAQGDAAAMRAAVFLAQRVLQPKETVVAVNDRLCSGCGLCVSECPYGARFLDAETGKARVIEALCLGCGACAVICRNNATQQHGYEKARVMSAIETALG